MTTTGGHHRRLAASVDARVRGQRASHAYRGVLALIILSFLFSASAPDEPWTRGVLLLIVSATLATALWRSREEALRVPMLAIFAAAVLAMAQIVDGGKALTTAAGVLSGLFVPATIVVIARGVIPKGEVNQESIIGAIGIYLLLGMLFTFAYAVLALEGAGPFFAQGTDGTRATRLYFSYATLTHRRLRRLHGGGRRRPHAGGQRGAARPALPRDRRRAARRPRAAPARDDPPSP